MLKNNQVVTGIIQGMDEAHNGILRCGKDIVLVRHVMKQEEVRVKNCKAYCQRIYWGGFGN